jgi:hypothetical protein
MGTARRLYLYVVSLVSLLALVGGVGSLLQTFFQPVEDAARGAQVMGSDFTRGQAALSVALIAVGGPIWLLHWWLARRGLRAPGPGGEEDRASALRAAYLTVVLTLTLGAGIAAVVNLAQGVLERLLGVTDPQGWSVPLAVGLTAVPVWAAHARSRGIEIRTTRLRGAAAWVTRLYRYGAAYALLVLLLGGAVGLVEVLLSVGIGRPDFRPGDQWWRLVVAGQLASVAVGGAALLIHWRDAGTIIRDAALIGEDDRTTRLRAAFFGGSLLTTIAWAALAVTAALADAGRWLTGMTRGDLTVFLEQVVGPPLAVLPVVACAWWLVVAMRREAAAVGFEHDRATRRLTALLPALAGLALLAAGIIGLIEIGLSRLAGTEPVAILSGQDLNFGVPWHLAQAVVGTVLWLPSWLTVLRARQLEPDVERTSTAARAYLFLVVGTALVAAVPTGVMIMYRMLDTILGARPSLPLVEELAFPIAVVLVAAVAGGYHARILAADLVAGGAAGRAAVAPAASLEASGAPVGVVPPAASVELVLEVPGDQDARAVLAGLQAHLPPGVHLDMRPTH